MFMRVAIAPTEIKVNAAKDACIRVCSDVLGASVVLLQGTRKGSSGVPEQPIGIVWGTQGSVTRASDALGADSSATHGLGVENFVTITGGSQWDVLLFAFLCWTRWWLVVVPMLSSIIRRWLLTLTFGDVASITLVDRVGKKVMTTSLGIPVPTAEAVDAIMGRQTFTAGSRIAARTGCNSADWHSLYTNGHMGRERILADAIYTVIVFTLTSMK